MARWMLMTCSRSRADPSPSAREGDGIMRHSGTGLLAYRVTSGGTQRLSPPRQAYMGLPSVSMGSFGVSLAVCGRLNTRSVSRRCCGVQTASTCLMWSRDRATRSG